jgi:hypothetical protein
VSLALLQLSGELASGNACIDEPVAEALLMPLAEPRVSATTSARVRTVFGW